MKKWTIYGAILALFVTHGKILEVHAAENDTRKVRIFGSVSKTSGSLDVLPTNGDPNIGSEVSSPDGFHATIQVHKSRCNEASEVIKEIDVAVTPNSEQEDVKVAPNGLISSEADLPADSKRLDLIYFGNLIACKDIGQSLPNNMTFKSSFVREKKKITELSVQWDSNGAENGTVYRLYVSTDKGESWEFAGWTTENKYPINYSLFANAKDVRIRVTASNGLEDKTFETKNIPIK